MENHKWVHDKTANSTHVPRDCNGTFEAAVDQQKKLIMDSCRKCGRKEAAHDPLGFDDHSKCIMTCANCGEQWPCAKLYPQDKPCKGTKGVVDFKRPEDDPRTPDPADHPKGQKVLGEQGEFDPNDCRGCEAQPATQTCMECKNRYCNDCMAQDCEKTNQLICKKCIK